MLSEGLLIEGSTHLLPAATDHGRIIDGIDAVRN